MRNLLAVTTMAATLAALSAPGVVRAADETKTVEATGSAAVLNTGDVASAKDRARKDALRNAVEMVAGANVTSVTTVKDFQLVNDAVSSKAEGMVKEYTVLEEKNEGGVYNIKIRATVSKAAAQDAYALALMEANHPKVAFIIAERMAGQTDFSLANQERGKTENMMVEYFMERGLTVVELGGLTGVNLNGAASTGELSAADAEKIAEKADAQYVVIGKVVGVDAGPVMVQGLRSYNMSLTLKMFSTSNHEIIATSTSSNAIPCISPNLAPISCAKTYKERVVNVASMDLLSKTATYWSRANSTGAKRVQVRAKVSNFAALQKFVKSLPDEVRGVSSVQQRSFKGGNAILDIELEGGDTNYLAGELSSRKVGGSGIDVLGVNGDVLEIEIKK